jgi:hypothetical protein
LHAANGVRRERIMLRKPHESGNSVVVLVNKSIVLPDPKVQLDRVYAYSSLFLTAEPIGSCVAGRARYSFEHAIRDHSLDNSFHLVF